MTETAVNVYNTNGQHRVVLVCEHASAVIPEHYNNLGLDQDVAKSHIAWDPGAKTTARLIADQLDAVLVEGTVSRLIYDCNRPPDASDAMIVRSEIYDVPGNVGISATERQHRVNTYYQPFKNKLTNLLSQHATNPVLVTVHSFTPVYQGVRRDVEIGLLHDEDTRLADAMLSTASAAFNVRLNEPYGPEDGVTHTLKLHGLKNQYLNIMIELRNDLLCDDSACKSIASHLNHWLTKSLDRLENASQEGAEA